MSGPSREVKRMHEPILVINAGSSSIKFSVFEGHFGTTPGLNFVFTPNYPHPPGLQSTIAGGASSIVIPEPEDPGPRNPLLPGAPKGSSVTACVVRPSTSSAARLPSLSAAA